jgi:NADH-quinone oxidoreductase subunit J
MDLLNINFEKLRAGFISYLPLGISVALLLFVEVGSLLLASLLAPAPVATPSTPIPDLADVGNAQAIGNVLYTHYLLAFQLSGLILLVSMIGAIVLTLRHRLGVKRQNISQQLSRKRHEAVELVDVKPGQGVKI